MTLATTWKVQWGASVGGGEREGAVVASLRPLDSAQCEWERLTWPFFAQCLPSLIPRGCFCLVVLL